jgi:protein-tyrosine phosphatase
MPENRRAVIGVPQFIRQRKSSRLITIAILLCASFLSAHLLEVGAQDFAFKGVANFRDIGGYSTGGGHKIKSGVIFRSGELSGLTSPDQEKLAGMNIRYEIDLRTEVERAANPSNWGKKVPQLVWISVMQSDATVQATTRQFSDVKDAEGAKNRMAQTTANLAIDGASNIGRVLGELAKANGPALIHCSAGKDRTGVTVAILMTLLGASRGDVYHEYLRSNESIDAQLQRQKAREQTGKDTFSVSGLQPEVVKTMMGTEASYMDAMFREITAKYGSFDAFTRDGLKLTAAQIAQLRKNLVN